VPVPPGPAVRTGLPAAISAPGAPLCTCLAALALVALACPAVFWPARVLAGLGRIAVAVRR
jgi:hypothetical protein